MLNIQFTSDTDPDTDVSLSFYAADRILGEVIFSERFIFDIGKLIQRKGSYNLNETLKSVRLPSGQEIKGQFLFIIAKSLKENLDFGVLFNRLEGGGYHIVGLWPRDFAEICKVDHEVFEFLMYRLINTPEFFSKVSLYQLPSTEMPKMEVKPAEVEIKPPPAVKAKPSPPPAVKAKPSPPPAVEVKPSPPPAVEVKPSPPPAVEVKPSPPPKIPAAAAEVKAAIKPPQIEIKPPPTPPKVELKPKEPVTVEIPPDLLEGRCPHCKAPLPEPRLRVLQSGGNTFCPKCLKILKGFKAPVEIKPVVEVGITTITKRELEELVKTAEENVKRGEYDKAASNYRKAAAKAKLLEQKQYAKELEDKAKECSKKVSSTKLQELIRNADRYFEQKSYENAIKEYRIAIDLAKRANDVEALRTLNARIRKCAESIVTTKIEGYLTTAELLLKEEKYDEAKQNYIQALELEKKLGRREKIQEIERNIENCEKIPLKKKLREASGRADKAFKMDKFEEAANYYHQAASYASQLKDRDAQAFFEQKIRECKTIPLRQSIQNVINSAQEKFQSNDFAAAVELYKKALESASQLADKDLIRELENKIKECDLRAQINSTTRNAEKFLLDKNFELALSLYNDTLKIARKLNDDVIIGHISTKIKEIQNILFNQNMVELISKADILMAEGKYADAKDRLEKAQKLATQLNDTTKIQEISEKIKKCEASLSSS